MTPQPPSLYVYNIIRENSISNIRGNSVNSIISGMTTLVDVEIPGELQIVNFVVRNLILHSIRSINVCEHFYLFICNIL